jgi:hypothetical protein
MEASTVGADNIKLNVCGKRMHVARSTLVADQESMLARMFSQGSQLQPAETDEKGYFVLDRDVRLFRTVLQFLRTGVLMVDSRCSRQALLEEARYFQLSRLEALLREPEPDFDRVSLVRGERLLACNVAFSSLFCFSHRCAPAARARARRREAARGRSGPVKSRGDRFRRSVVGGRWLVVGGWWWSLCVCDV